MSETGSVRSRHLVIACGGCGNAGSVASVALHHAQELSRYMRVTLISDGFPSVPVAGVECELVAPPGFGFLRRFAHLPNEYAFVRAVRRRLSQLQAQGSIGFVICHSHALAALAAYPFRRQQGVPFALVTHGDIFYRQPGTYDPRLTWFYRRVTPPAYRNADLIIALSPFMAECAVRGGADTRRVKVVPNGIDPADIGVDVTASSAGRVEDTGPHKLRILFVGRLSAEKGIEDLIMACVRLSQRGVLFSLRIAGEGSLKASLQELVRRHGLGESVVFSGAVPRAGLGRYYASCDVVCVPSLSEPLATVILEALISGCPVVASDTGGNPFMVEHEVNGLLTPAGNADDLAEALARLCHDPVLLRKLAANARQSVKYRFSWKRSGAEIAALIAGAERG